MISVAASSSKTLWFYAVTPTPVLSKQKVLVFCFESQHVLHFIISPLKIKRNPPWSVNRFHTECNVLQPVFHFNSLKISAKKNQTKKMCSVIKLFPDLQLSEWAAPYLHNFQLLKKLEFKYSLATRVWYYNGILWPFDVTLWFLELEGKEAVMNNSISTSMWIVSPLSNFSLWNKMSSCILSIW